MNEQEKRNGIVDRLNSLYNAGQLSRLARGAILSPVKPWPIIIVLVIIPLITLGIGLATFSPGTASGLPVVAVQTPAPVFCTTIDQSPGACLKKDFNIETSGFSNTELKDIYNAFSLVYSYPLYKNAWNKGNRKLIITNEPPFHAETIGTCTGEALPGRGGDDKLKLWNPGGKCTFYGGMAYLIIHEVGHILSDRDGSLLNKFTSEYRGLIGGGDSCYKFYVPPGPGGDSCYTAGDYYLKTYIGPGHCVNEENFAEGTADYVLYKTWAPAQDGKVYSLEDFPNQCPATYSWFKNNVFGQ